MRIFAFGSNGAGQLGLHHRDDISDPQECVTDSVHLEPPIKLAAGGNHTLILFPSGELHKAGSLDHYSAANKSCQSASTKLIPVSLPDGLGKIKLCASNWSTATVVSERNTLVTWGSGDKGELGRGEGVTSTKASFEPIRLAADVETGSSIVDLASSVHHTVAVLSNGDVYGWGNGRKSQLGHPAGIVWEPRKIVDVDFKITRAVCGREFTYLVADPATGRHKVLGTDKWGIQTDAPKSCLGWKDVGASWSSIFVLKGDGTLVSWGRNDHGQLAPPGLLAIKQMAVGSEHVLALTNSDKLLAWGWGEHGNCGSSADKNGDTKPEYNKIYLPDIDLKNVGVGLGAGCATSWVWITDSP